MNAKLKVIDKLRPTAFKIGNFAVPWSRKISKYLLIRIKRSWRVLKVEMAPPKLSDVPEMTATAQKLMNSAITLKFVNLTLREITINLVIALDIIFCFFLGEIIGKRSLLGYNLRPVYRRSLTFKEMIKGIDA